MARSVVTGSKRSHGWAKRRMPFGSAFCAHSPEIALLTSLNGLMVIIPDSSGPPSRGPLKNCYEINPVDAIQIA